MEKEIIKIKNSIEALKRTSKDMKVSFHNDEEIDAIKTVVEAAENYLEMKKEYKKLVNDRDLAVKTYESAPEDFGFKTVDLAELQGGTAAENAEITKKILKGEERGPKRQAVCLNAGAALYIAGKAETMEAGVRMAEELIDSGAALKKLEEFIQESNA